MPHSYQKPGTPPQVPGFFFAYRQRRSPRDGGATRGFFGFRLGGTCDGEGTPTTRVAYHRQSISQSPNHRRGKFVRGCLNSAFKLPKSLPKSGHTSILRGPRADLRRYGARKGRRLEFRVQLPPLKPRGRVGVGRADEGVRRLDAMRPQTNGIRMAPRVAPISPAPSPA